MDRNIKHDRRDIVRRTCNKTVVQKVDLSDIYTQQVPFRVNFVDGNWLNKFWLPNCYVTCSALLRRFHGVRGYTPTTRSYYYVSGHEIMRMLLRPVTLSS
jgi:hypothetical protein